MDGPTAAEVGTYEEDLKQVLSCSDDADAMDGGYELPVIVVDDPWSSKAVRRALQQTCRRQFGSARLADDELQQACPVLMGLAEQGPNLLALLTMPQEALDNIRANRPDLRPFLDVAARYLLGAMPLREAFAGCTSLASLCRTRLARKGGDHERALELWRLRLQGLTGHEVADRSGVSHQRVYQINVYSKVAFLRRLEAACNAPLIRSLFVHHLDAAGLSVMRAASSADGVIRRRDIERLTWEVLPAEDAFVLAAVQDVRGDAAPELAQLLAWETRCASPLADGWTLLPLVEADVAAVREAYQATALGGWLALAPDIATRTGLGEAQLAAALRFAGMARLGEAVIPSKARPSERRIAAAAGILHAAPRPLHATEMLDTLLGTDNPALKEVSYRTLILDLQDEPEIFRQHGGSVFSIIGSAHVLNGDEDPRPAVPEASFDEMATAWTPPGQLTAVPWAAADYAGDFVADVAATLRERRVLSERSEVSVSELILPEEEEALLRWARDAAAPLHETTRAGRAEIGMVLFAAHSAAAQLSDAGGRDTWRILPDVAGPGVRGFMFDGEVPRGRMLDAMVRATDSLGLRRPWSFNCDHWITAFRLQCGFHRGDTALLRDWILDPVNLPAAVRLISRDPASGMSRLLADIRLAVAGRLAAGEVHARHAGSPWWPGWSAEEFAKALVPEQRVYQPRPYVPAPRTPASEEPPEDLLGSSAVAPSPGGAKPTAADAAEGIRWQLSVAPGAVGFRLQLPSSLCYGEGAVTVLCGGARAGGHVGTDGAITWYAEDNALLLPLAGPRVRSIEVQRDGRTLDSFDLELWAADAYLRLIDLRTSRPVLIDPFRSRLSPSAPVALLCHEALALSHAPPEERRLNTEHRLMVFPGGLPDGFAVSCEGEVVWQPTPPDPGREVVDLPGVSLTGDASPVAWGEGIQLQPVGLPQGFEPTRAVIGGQSLRPVTPEQGGGWALGGYRVLPGASPLLRQGRLDGLLDGRKVSIPLAVALRRTPRGAALHDGERWQGIPEGFWLDRSRHAGQRLWAPRAEGDDVPWVMFEGARPVAAVGQNGVHVGRSLFGLGEMVGLGRGGFDQSNAPLRVAPCRDTGMIRSVSLTPEGAVLHLSAQLGSHVEPRATAWWNAGPQPLPAVLAPDGASVRVAFTGGRPFGIVLSADTEWLGTAYLVQAAGAISQLLLAPDTAAALGFALDARLPVLLDQIRKGLGILLGRNPSLVGVLLSRLGNPVSQHAAAVLLGTWQPPAEVARSMVQAHLAGSDAPGRASTDLERLGAIVPTALLRVLPYGWDLLSRGERPAVLAGLAVSPLPQVNLSRLAQGVGVSLPEVEEGLLAEAVSATRCDPNFLASRSEASVLSLAWRFLTDTKATDMPRTLQTALTLPSLRRWLNAALLRRLMNEAR